MLCLVCLCVSVQAQKQTVKFLSTYDNQQLHFGFLLGINSANFIVKTSPDIASLDSVLSVEPYAQSGFSLGIVSDLRMNQHMNLRFLTTLSFAERGLTYRVRSTKQNAIIEQKKNVESTFLMFPFNVKYRAARLNNYRVYLVAGATYMLDLASQEGADQNLKPEEIFVRIHKSDLLFEVGMGIDFYLEFFKFTPEIKMGFGIPDLLVHEDQIYSQAIRVLRSKMVMFTFYFE